jgi:uncharacterized protein (DUF885 family)
MGEQMILGKPAVWFLGAVMMMTGVIVEAQQGVPGETGGSDEFNHAVDEYFANVYFKYAPTQGTLAGVHEYDAQLEDYSRGGVDAEIKDLHAYATRFEKIARPTDLTAAGDYDLVVANIQSQLLALEKVRGWEKNPDNYSSGITSSAYSLMERTFASPDDRLRSLIAREKQMPAALQAARVNLVNPPKIYTEIALEQLPDLIKFFQNDVPAAFKDAKDAQLKAEFSTTNAAVIAALQDYEKWLKKDVLKRSHGDFQIGADTFQKKLLYDEMVDTPVSELLDVGYADLHKNQAAFVKLANEIDPKRTPKQVLAELVAMHPADGQVLSTFQSTFDGLVAFIKARQIVTIPSDVRPKLQDTPPFMRAITFASMDTPGAYEKVAKEAYFNVTVPEPGMTPRQRNAALEGFNFGTIVSTSVHEAWPGHYVQFLWVQTAASKVRKLLGASSNAEGWAHYCEQMMLDEGYGQPGVGAKDAREAQFIRLGQLQDALLRDARFIVGIQMHTGKWTMKQSEEFFVTEGYQVKSVGVTETKRGTSDPTYLYYTLGKLQIMKLRADYKAKLGDAYTLEKFHNEFLQQGFPPLKIVRRAMLGNDSPTL